MTDYELKFDIIRNQFLKIAREEGHLNEEEAIEQVDDLMKEKPFINSMMTCMDHWAGLISKRIDESDENE